MSDTSATLSPSPAEPENEEAASPGAQLPPVDDSGKETKKRVLDAAEELSDGKRSKTAALSGAEAAHSVEEPDGKKKRSRDDGNRRRLEKDARDYEAMLAWERIQLSAQEQMQKEEKERRAARESEDESPVRSALDTMLGVLVAEEHSRRERYK